MRIGALVARMSLQGGKTTCLRKCSTATEMDIPLFRGRRGGRWRSTMPDWTRRGALRIETQLGVLRPGRFDEARISLGEGPQSAAQQRLLEAIKS